MTAVHVIHVCSRVNAKKAHEYSRLFTPPFRGREYVNGEKLTKEGNSHVR